MTLLFFDVRPERILLLSDSLNTMKFQPHSFGRKFDVLPHGTLATRGEAAIGDTLASDLSVFDVDQAEPIFGRLVFVRASQANPGGVFLTQRPGADSVSSPCQAVFCGWSAAHGRMRAISANARDPESATNVLADGLTLLSCLATDVPPLSDHMRSDDKVVSFMRRLANLVDNHFRTNGTVGIGGEQILTTITRNGATSKVVGRFDSYAQDAAAVAAREAA